MENGHLLEVKNLDNVIIEIGGIGYKIFMSVTSMDRLGEVGTEVRKGDEITLYIPDVYEEYPDFVGENWLVSDVEEFCEKNNIKLTIEYQETNQYAPGKIISQSRTGRIVSGATLKIVVAEEISLPEEIAPTPDDEDNTEEDN